jgi:protein-glutamine gamma-glutamyltransferase
VPQAPPASARTSDVPIAGSAERFFQWSLYLLLVTGFVALMGTGKLDLASVGLVTLALIFRGYLLLMRKTLNLEERWTSYLTLVYFVFYVADYFYFSQSFVAATVHMVLFSMIIKIFSVRKDRDLLYLAVLSFMMVLAAAVLTVDMLFLVNFSVYIGVGIATFVSMEMRRASRDGVSAGIPQSQDGQFHRALAGGSALLGILTLAGAGLIFLVLPRVSNAGYLRSFATENSITSGFSQEVRLGGIGQIQQSSAVVMHVQVTYGRLPVDVKWRGTALANFDGQRWWTNPEPPVVRALGNTPLDLSRTVGRLYSGAVAPSPLPTFRYRVVMEPLGLNLFFLAPAPTRLTGEYRLVAIQPNGTVQLWQPPEGSAGSDEQQNIGVYTAEADARDPQVFVRNSVSRDYPGAIARMYLQLPARLDPRVAELARTVTASSASNYAQAVAIQSYLKSNYSYTLQLPGVNAPDQLAYFLFDRKKGHCEYFATAMTIMLRTRGIPARVVNGFRGGEFNSVNGSYIVREQDAHSWVEAYYPEFGWVTFDPTPSQPAPSNQHGWARVLLYMDAAREVWREWVVNYDFSHQVKLSSDLATSTGNAQSKFRVWMWRKYRRLLRTVSALQHRLEIMPATEMATWIVVLALILSLPFAPRAWRSFERSRALRNPQRAPRTSASFWYLRLLKRLRRRGLLKEPTQTPEEFAASIADPDMRRDVVVFTEHYERARFDESVEDATKLPELYEEIAGRKT